MVDDNGPDLTGRVSVVTGATRGIGRQIALGLAARGSDLVVVGRTSSADGGDRPLPGSIEDTVDEARGLGANAIGVQANLADEAQTDEVVRRTLDGFGRCDILVNNAAYTSNGPMLEVPWHRWLRAFRVNVVAPHQLCHGFVPGMTERGDGAVLNISTGASQRPLVGLGMYSASKIALERWAESLDLETTAIAVNTLRVNRLVATEGWQHIAATQPAEVAYGGGSPDTVPVTAESVAAAALWMLGRPTTWSGHTVDFEDIVRLGGPELVAYERPD